MYLHSLTDLKECLVRKYIHCFFISFSLIILSHSGWAEEVYCSLNDGMKADGKTVLEHQGAKHQFCCSGCLEQFKLDPEKFSKQIHQNTPAGPSQAEAACSSVCGE